MHPLTLQLWAYALLVAGSIPLFVWALVASKHQWTTVVLASCHFIAVVSGLVLMSMRANGASTIRQLNAPSGSSMDWWSFWVDFWPVSLLALIGAFIFALVAAIGIAFRAKQKTLCGGSRLHAMTAVFTLLHIAAVFFATGSNFPDA